MMDIGGQVPIVMTLFMLMSELTLESNTNTQKAVKLLQKV